MATQTPTVINKLAQKALDALKVGVPSALLIFPTLKAEPLHTISRQIPSSDALAPGAQSITIPFKTIDGSLKINGNVNEQGVFSLTEMIPSQRITADSASNVVSFFVDSLENPLKFRVIEANADSIKLAPLDSLALWRELVLANNHAIKGILASSSPLNPAVDTNLSKWNTVIETAEAKGAGSSFNIKFERNSAFITSDTLYLPFNQVYLNQEMVRGAVLGIKIKDKIGFARAAYNFKPAGWQYPMWLFQDTLVGPSLDIKLAINDTENKGYDSLMTSGFAQFPGSIMKPFRIIYPIENPMYQWFKNDPPRVDVPNGKNALNDPNIPCPDSVWFKAGGTVKIRSPTMIGSDGIRVTFNSGLSYIVISGLSLQPSEKKPGDRYLGVACAKNGNSYMLKNQLFEIWEYYMKDGKLTSKAIDSIPSFQNYFGINGEISSKDSITFMPTDSKYMAKLSFMATNNYQKGNPYQRINTNLLYSYPQEKAIDVPVDTAIYFKFNKLLDTSSINNNTLFLQSISGPAPDSNGTVYPGWISGKIVYNMQDSSIKFIPDEKLAYETLHRTTIRNVLGIDKEPLDTTLEFTTMRDTTVGVNEKYSAIARELLYPNPAENSTTLKIELEKGQAVELKLYDTFGNEKTVFSSKYMGKGEHNIPIDLNGLSSGAYLIRESRSGKTRKLVKR